MSSANNNTLVSTKASDSGLQAHLHPLVLLTISDLIARRTLRRQEGPIVGAIFGQQKGREISLEHASECQVIQKEDGTSVLHDAWFKDRVQQYRDVHKAPALEVVGWFTTAPPSGPEFQHLAIHQQLLLDYNETALMLAFHPSTVLAGAQAGGKLPLTIYESVYESGLEGGKAAPADEDGDNRMEIEGQEAHLDLKFRELPYTVETGEAEMIGVDYIARGAGNATAIDGTSQSVGKNRSSQASQTPVGTVDPKRLGKTDVKATDDTSTLSAEDDELITSLTVRINAVKMLHARIQLLKTYLQNLPPSYLNSPDLPSTDPATPSENYTEINHPILRSIQALINRLALLTPADPESFEQESLAERNDVSLVSLLGSLSNNVRDARELGRKFGVIDQARQHASKNQSFARSGDLFGGHGIEGNTPPGSDINVNGTGNI
ncbi:MAG: hypothetical protein Q9191_003686 [Dirinaria sp. TL-2023a]